MRAALAALPDGAGEGSDARAVEVMRRALDRDLGDEPEEAASASPAATSPCTYDAAALASGPEGTAALQRRMYACFGEAARRLSFEGRTIDRLTVFSLLPRTDEPGRRRTLFMAFEPVWRAVSGDGGPSSPYRVMIRGVAARQDAAPPATEAARQLGLAPEALEEWLTSILQAWRDASPAAPIEPWDFAYESGRAARLLAPLVPRESLAAINDRYYGDLGADPDSLEIGYDLELRDGKDPVAFTTFGGRARFRGDAWTPARPWVFASYGAGGLDNLGELLHETGHAVHIAAVRTRPAFADWPDSDLFTEAIADLAALEMYEPAWQARYLGQPAPLADSIRAKYAGIVMDVAWALFEIRMLRDPSADPNRVWTDITQKYFRIRPHPELSWWAVRGQLVDLPGYMLNYAAGAVLVADLRARARELRGPLIGGDATWYAWVSERLYRFGLERPSRQVVEEFLGRPVSPDALLADMKRAAPR